MALVAVHGENTFHIGDLVRVHQKVQEESPPAGEAGKTRIQVFEGTVIAIRGEGENRTFTVRRIGVGGVGVERIFPLYSPLLEKVEVKARGSVRRAKLYYLRRKSAHEIAEITRKHHRARHVAKPPRRSRSKSKIKKLKTDNRNLTTGNR